MLRWIAKALASSIGKKIVMAVTGCLILMFLVEHLIGNSMLYLDEDGTAFNAFVHSLKAVGPLLIVAEVMLGMLFVVHIFLAIQLTLENRAARAQKYVVRNDRGGQTVASTTMILTGLLLLAFLVIHLVNFRFDGSFGEDPTRSVKQAMSDPATAWYYFAALGILGFHISHGFQSALQSLGINHPRWSPLLRRAGIAIAILFPLAFASFPIFYLFFWTEGGAN